MAGLERKTKIFTGLALSSEVMVVIIYMDLEKEAIAEQRKQQKEIKDL